MSDPPVDLEQARAHGLTDEEYANILELLGRVPTFPELGIFSVMWAEHCSYKSSKPYLTKLPTEGPQVIEGPGENAGVVSIGDGLAAVFKIESHNHPSYVEPHAGAATGVGGILRDIFTMGARTLASLDSLRFGPLDDPHQRYLVRGVVSGIADYGNCFGCATVGGEVTSPMGPAGCLHNRKPLIGSRKGACFLYPLGLRLAVGAGIDTQADFAWAREILGDTTLSGLEKMKRVYRACEARTVPTRPG